MSLKHEIAFLRVLIAAAWADGEMTYEELNSLKAYFRELDLDSDALAELEPYLADPIGEEEARTIIDDFLTLARSAERETLLAAVRDLLLSDNTLADGEKQFLKLLDHAKEETSTARVFVGQLKRFWGSRAATGDDKFRRSDLLDEFVRNRVLYQVKRRLMLATGGAPLDEETERDLRYVCTVGALLGQVAAADQNFDADERATIAELLDSISSLQHSDVDVIVDIVESEVLSDVGYQPFVREYNEMASGEDKRRLLTLLFQVAAADGAISHEEHEEIRKISKALNVEHSEFIAAKQAIAAAGQ